MQFADRAKRAILNQSPMQTLSINASGSLNKLKSVLLDNMTSEMEKLRKENAELKSHLFVMRQSSSLSQDFLGKSLEVGSSNH